jgi:hypothetical protein
VRPPIQNPLAAAAALCAALLIPSTARSTEFRYQALPSCPSAEEFRARVPSLEGVEGAPAEISVRVDSDARGALGTLRVVAEDGRELERKVLAPTCTEVAEALSIVLDQMRATRFIDLAESPLPATSPAAPEEGAAAKPGAAPVSPTAPQTEAAAEQARTKPPPASPAPRSGTEAVHALRLGVGWVQPLPSAGRFGLTLGYAVNGRALGGAAWEPLTAGMDVWLGSSTSVEGDAGNARFQLAALRPELSWRVFRPARSLAVRVGASTLVGVLWASGEGVTPAKQQATTWWSIEPHVSVVWDAFRRGALAVRGGADVPLIRNDFRLRGEERVYEPRAAGLMAEMSAQVRF